MRGSFWKQTRSEKVGSIDGLNLFFGALLGANLGTLDRLPIGEYVQLIILLACTVGVLRMVSTTDRRLYALGTLAAYIALVAWHFTSEATRPKGLSWPDIQRLAATLAVWIVAVLAIEFAPTQPDRQRDERPPRGPGIADQA